MKQLPFCLLLTLIIGSCNNEITPNDQQMEEDAIKKCIADETKAWINRDTVAWLNAYSQLPNSMQVWNNRDGSWSGNEGWDNVFRKNIKGFRSDGKLRTDRFETSKWVIQLCGPDWAWVKYEQVIQREPGRVFPTHETRLMKKIDGNWKLAGSTSIWDYTKTGHIGDVLKNQVGKVVLHECGQGCTEYLIETNLFNKTMTLFPIGLPDAFKKNNKDITFDGEFLYTKEQLYKPGPDNRPALDRLVNHVRVDAIQ